MRCSLRLGEFDFSFEYRKGLQKTQATTLSRLHTLGKTTADIDEEIPCYLDTTDEPNQGTRRMRNTGFPPHHTSFH